MFGHLLDCSSKKWPTPAIGRGPKETDRIARPVRVACEFLLPSFRIPPLLAVEAGLAEPGNRVCDGHHAYLRKRSIRWVANGTQGPGSQGNRSR